MAFRDDQRPIMAYVQGTMAIPAVPGAGKTFIIANLVTQIIKNKNHRPGKILIVTYMNSAVNNFKARVAKSLEEKGMDSKKDYEVMTIHSLAVKILKDRPDVVMINDDFQILDDTRKELFLKKAIDHWRRRDQHKTFYSYLDKKNSKWDKGFYDVVHSLISTLKFYEITPQEGEKITMAEDSLLKAIFPIYKDYDQLLKSNGYLDYDDLLIMAYRILDLDKRALEKFQQRYTYILEDECQDSNLIQQKILTTLSKGSNNLVRVGDVNQSITGTFTSSDPRFFKEFCKGADHIHRMDRANRSSKDIIELANYFVDYVMNHHPEEMCRKALADQKIRMVPKGPWGENPKTDKYGIIAFRENTWEDEIKRTIKWIISFKKKYPNKTIGVLVPTNKQGGQISQRLAAAEIDYDELSSTSEKKMGVCKEMGYILHYLSAPYDNRKFVKLMEWLLRNKKENEKRTLIDVLIHNPLENILYPLIDTPMDNLFPESLRGSGVLYDFGTKISMIKKIMELAQHNPALLILEIGDILGFEGMEKAMVDAIIGYVTQWRREDPSLTLAMIAEELLKENNNGLRRMGDVIYDLDGFEPSHERVSVSTYHRAKGLEWDCVFLLGMTSYNFPSFLSQKIRSEYGYLKEQYKNPTAVGKWEIEKIKNSGICDDPAKEAKIELINERIRLLYVGITRAKEFLVMMSHGYNKDYNIKEEDSVYFMALSEFVNPRRNKDHD